MKHTTIFVGLDVSEDTIAFAVAEGGCKEVRFIGTYPNTVNAVHKVVEQLGGSSVRMEF